MTSALASGALEACSGAGARDDAGRAPRDAETLEAGAAPPTELRASLTVNHEPVLDDVRFVGARVVCGPSTQLCASAHDQDGDPLELTLTPEARCTVTSHDVESKEPGAGADSTVSACFTLSCHELGDVDLHVQAHDLTSIGDELVRIEDVLGPGRVSRAELALSVAFRGELLWPDADGDGQGDARALAAVACDDEAREGRATNGDDCDDGDDAIKVGAPERCGDRADDDCDGLRDEKCILRSQYQVD